MSTWKIELMDSSKFSVVGPDWSARLRCWAKVPKGPLLLDVEVVEEDGRQTAVQMYYLLDNEGSLNHYGQWQLAP